jgi:hypothetical protein
VSGHTIVMLTPQACRARTITVRTAIWKNSVIELLALLALDTFQVLPISFLSYRLSVFEIFLWWLY